MANEFYCPCCGKIVSNIPEEHPCNCCFCKTEMIDLNISTDDWWNKTVNDDSYENNIRNTLVKTNPLFNQEQFDAREYSEKHVGDTIRSIAHCPICNSTNIQKIGIGNKVTSGAVFGIFSLGHISKTFKCNSCGMKF